MTKPAWRRSGPRTTRNSRSCYAEWSIWPFKKPIGSLARYRDPDLRNVGHVLRQMGVARAEERQERQARSGDATPGRRPIEAMEDPPDAGGGLGAGVGQRLLDRGYDAFPQGEEVALRGFALPGVVGVESVEKRLHPGGIGGRDHGARLGLRGREAG